MFKQISQFILRFILKILAQIVLWKYKPFIIGITGSVGKTSTKEAIYYVLSARFSSERVRRNIKNYNNEIGVPLTILGLESGGGSIKEWLKLFLRALKTILFRTDYPAILILEMGADRPGDIKYLVKFVHPKIAVITAVGEIPVHVEFFKSPVQVAREKAVLAQSLSENDWLILNYDDEAVRRIRGRKEVKLLTYGFEERADVRAINFETLDIFEVNSAEADSPQVGSTGSPQDGSTRLASEAERAGSPQVGSTGSPQVGSTGSPQVGSTGSPQVGSTGSPQVGSTGSPQDGLSDLPQNNGVNFKIDYKGKVVPVRLKGILGRHQVYALLAGVAVGIVFEMNLIEIAEVLQNYQSLPGRMRLLQGIKNSWIIDDTYNASPSATIEALTALGEINMKEGAFVRRNLGEGGKKIAVLGDMLELGQFTERAHRMVGKKLVGIADIFFTIGARAAFIADEAKKQGFPAEKIFEFDTSDEAKKAIQEKIEEGDLILVKGSQGMRMEKIVEEIMDEPLRAKELLVRQGEEWKR